MPDPRTTLSILRSAVGAGSWIAPATSWRTFGLGAMPLEPTTRASSGVISRLFGVRDLALGVVASHPDPAVRRAVLQVGVAVDGVDVVASLLGLRAGAPRASGLGVAVGAASFLALGVLALRRDDA